MKVGDKHLQLAFTSYSISCGTVPLLFCTPPHIIHIKTGIVDGTIYGFPLKTQKLFLKRRERGSGQEAVKHRTSFGKNTDVLPQKYGCFQRKSPMFLFSERVLHYCFVSEWEVK